MITINRAVFQQLAAQVRAGLPGVAAQISEANRVQIVEGGNVVEEFSTAEDFCNALFRGTQVPAPGAEDCKRMVRNAGIREAERAIEPDDNSSENRCEA